MRREENMRKGTREQRKRRILERQESWNVRFKDIFVTDNVMVTQIFKNVICNS